MDQSDAVCVVKYLCIMLVQGIDLDAEDDDLLQGD